MASNLVRVATTRLLPRAHVRAYSSVTTGLKDFGVEHVDDETRARLHPKIGNRDIVGYGWSGLADYHNCVMYPYPAVRFEANTPEKQALMEKSMGSWTKLSLEEQKALYRHSFQKTLAEVRTEGKAEWKPMTSGFFVCTAVTLLMCVWLRMYVYGDIIPSTMTKEHQLAVERKLISERVGIVEGLSSKWDYEANDWK